MEYQNSIQNKIDPFSLSLSDAIHYFRQLGYVNFQEFQRELYAGTLELYLEEEDE
jgi:hypothetical protein